MEYIIIGDNVEMIGDNAFYRSGLKSIILGNGLKRIGESAFGACPLYTVSIPDSVTAIEHDLFIQCVRLRKVIFGTGLVDAHRRQFEYCYSLESVVVPESVTCLSDLDLYFDGDKRKVVMYRSLEESNKPVSLVMTVGSLDATINAQPAKTDVAPLVVNNRTMLPARFVAEALGAIVWWNGETRTVNIAGEGVFIQIVVDSDIAYINGQEVAIDSPAFLMQDRTYTPVRFVAEALGATVEWNGTERKVTIEK